MAAPHGFSHVRFAARSRLLLAMVALALIAAACSSTSAATTTSSGPDATPDLGKITVAVGAAQSIDFAPAEIGVERGVWEKRGLTVDNVFVRGGGEVARTIAANEAQIGLTTGPSAVTPIVKGLPAKLVGAASLSWVGFVIIVGTDSDIQTVADLEGKTIGFSRPGSTTDYVAERIASSQGWTMGTDIFKATVGGLPEMVAALKSGSIDAFAWTPEPAYALEEDGEARVIGNMGEMVGPNVFVCMSATDDLIENDAAVVQAYLDGWMETVQWMKDNPDEAIAWMSNEWGLSTYAITKAYEDNIDNLSTTGVIPEANLEGVANTVAELDEEIETPPDPTDFYDPQFVPVKLS